MKTKTKVKMDYMDLQAQDVNALVQLAFDKYHQGELDNALDIAQRSLELKNKNNPCVNLIGSILHSQGKVSESAHYFKEAIKHDPTNVECYYNLGVVLRQAGDMTASLSQQARALEINPEYIPSLNEAGLLYLAKKDNSSAGELLHRAYELDPKNRATLVNIAYHCTVMNLLNEAISFSQALIKVDPDCAEPYFTIGYALSKANFFEESVKYAKLSMNKTNKYSSEKEHYLLMNYLYSDQFSGEQIFEAHKSWSRKFLRNDAFPRRGNDDPHKKLKVGFISSDFREHSVSNFFLAIVENYNKSKFEYSCYSGVSQADFITERIRAAVDIWREVYDLSETGIVELIKQDEIDILVDLAGHSQGNYIRVFGHKPAPVQMTYLGYPFSTGLENMDYRITDEYADPKGMTEHLHTETLIRMPFSFLCYQPIDEDVSIDVLTPYAKNHYITFGSFNNLNKLSATTIRLWSEILQKTKGARLLMKSYRNAPDLLKEHLIAQFQSNGISYDRLIFSDSDDKRSDHLNRYNQVDICLDTFPYNGTTTTFEALWMGVPVVTLSGISHHSRVGESILTNMALPEMVARTAEQYVDKAVTLASDKALLQGFRQNGALRRRLLSSSLTDAGRFSLAFEAVLREAWVNYC